MALDAKYPNDPAALGTGNLSTGLDAVVDSAWFEKTKFDWQAFSQKELQAPYKPPVKSKKDVTNITCDHSEDKVPKFTGKQNLFEDF